MDCDAVIFTSDHEIQGVLGSSHGLGLHNICSRRPSGPKDALERCLGLTIQAILSELSLVPIGPRKI